MARGTRRQARAQWPTTARSVLTTLAVLVLVAGTSAPAAAHHCKGKHAADPECGDGGGGGSGGGSTDDTLYKVDVVLHSGFSFAAPTYLPTCSAETKSGTLSAWFPRHDLCATVTCDTGYELTDDISLQIATDKNDCITSFQLYGQDVIGSEGIAHESELVTFSSPQCVVDTGGFTLHVDEDWLPIWKLDKHRHVGGAKRVEIVGYISISDLLYSPVP